MVSLDKVSRFYGIAAFVFSVLWFFGLLFNVMMLGLLVVGAGIFGFQGYKRFSHQAPVQKMEGTKAEQYLKKVLAEQEEVTVTKNGKMDKDLEVLHEVFGGDSKQ